MTEQDLHDYNKWLTEVWSKQHSNIPFMKDAPNAYLKYRAKQLTLTDVSQQRELLKVLEYTRQIKNNPKDIQLIVDKLYVENL